MGKCRKCGSEIVELDQRYACGAEDCDVVYWKRSMGRYFDRATIKRLLSLGSISELHGFVRRADSEPYSTGCLIKIIPKSYVVALFVKKVRYTPMKNTLVVAMAIVHWLKAGE